MVPWVEAARQGKQKFHNACGSGHESPKGGGIDLGACTAD